MESLKKIIENTVEEDLTRLLEIEEIIELQILKLAEAIEILNTPGYWYTEAFEPNELKIPYFLE